MKSALNRITSCFVLLLALPGVQLLAATATPLTVGLLAPVKIINSAKGNLLVAEAGQAPNTGRISIIDPATGARRTLLAGLPSGPSIPDNSSSGPSGLAMRGRTLYVTIGLGDAVVNGALPRTQVPKAHPSSPIFCSILAVHFSVDAEKSTNGFTLSPADHQALKDGQKLNFDAGGSDKVSVELVADIPDYVPAPVAGEPLNVAQSNPFGVAIVDDVLFVNDASANTVRSFNLTTGVLATHATFAPIPNTRGFGPPVCEPVPDSIRLFNNQLLVTLLTGFPFPVGQAQVRTVDPETGATAPLILGLTSAIDVLPVSGGYLTLEFSGDMLAGVPGRIKWFSAANASPTIIFQGLVSPTSMARDAVSGDIFVTEIFTGRVLKVTP